MKHIANGITGFRIICSIALLFFPVESAVFVTLYLLCGISDMADGFAARVTRSSSEFGAKFDSVSDLVFVAAALIKWLPVISLPAWIWIGAAVTGSIRIGNVIWGLVSRKKWIFLHTRMNKVTGLLLFLLPLAAPFAVFEGCAAAVCAAALVSAIGEGFCLRTGQKIG